MNLRPWIVIVGGFLGAGKTTLLLAAARELERRGLRSALILNDQGDALVDSRLAALNGIDSGEVTGGCFCCRFSALVEVIEQLRQHQPDVIFAEPVGSCTDISATTIHQLIVFGDQYHVAPYTVLIDPQRANELLRNDAEPNLSFLFRNQIEEADLICFTKSDIYPDPPAVRSQAVRQVSAKTGQGVAAWLDEILSGRLSSGTKILDIDYQEYARAEAALVWLNAQATVSCRTPCSPATVLGPIFDKLVADLTLAGISIVHLKAVVNADSGFVKAASCANGQHPVVEGDLTASPALTHELLINIRAAGSAARVQAITERVLTTVSGRVAGVHISCFHPAPPQPERRIARDTVFRELQESCQ